MQISRFVTYKSIENFEKTSLFNLSSEFITIHEFSQDGYLRVWKNDNRLMIVTYCEGDIITQRFDTIEEYQQDLKKQAAYYENY